MKNKAFKKEVKNVIKMNKIHKDKVKFMDIETINTQELLVNEEIEETIQSIKNGQLDEFIDGVADVFVVASYKEFLMSNSKEDFYDSMDYQLSKEHDNDIEITYKNFIDQLKKIKDINETGQILKLLKKLIDFVDSITIGRKYGFNNEVLTVMEKAIREVMISNMTKFTLADSISFEEVVEEVNFVKNKYPDRDKIYPILRNDYIIYMSNNGKGKFLKPSTFVPVDLSWCNELKEIDLPKFFPN